MVDSDNLQALCDAAGNSASLSRKWTCLEPQNRALNKRIRKDARVRIMVSKNLNRRRKRRLGRSKKIPDISPEIMPPSAVIASGLSKMGLFDLRGDAGSRRLIKGIQHPGLSIPACRS
jgi:hypothetical protein